MEQYLHEPASPQLQLFLYQILHNADSLFARDKNTGYVPPPPYVFAEKDCGPTGHNASEYVLLLHEAIVHRFLSCTKEELTPRFTETLLQVILWRASPCIGEEDTHWHIAFQAHADGKISTARLVHYVNVTMRITRRFLQL